jgi:hypothetical protein
MPVDIRITTELLYLGALLFALMDAIYIPLLIWRVRPETFRRLNLSLVASAGTVWFWIWSWAIGNFWETVYVYVFPAWSRSWIPLIAFFAAGAVAYGLWALAAPARSNPVAVYCLLGALLGSLTHTLAVMRGILTGPPMLQGASPLAALVIAFFEFGFYWCVILTLAVLLDWFLKKLNASR